MRKRLLVLVAVCALVSAIVGCGSKAVPGQVTMKGQQFRPATLEVKVGDEVTWLNDDEQPHIVNGDGGIKSPTLDPGEKYIKTFSEPGTYTYICGIHPNMRGNIVVR